MKELMYLRCDPYDFLECTKKISSAIENDTWIQLSPPKGNTVEIPKNFLPKKPGIVISSGGSIEGPHHCLQPFSHLDQSAIATGQWLKNLGFEPKDCRIFNPLPMHHVSGLMPWWRSKIWEAKHTWLMPSLMRNPIELETSFKSLFHQNNDPLILSLVPTQLQRLINNPAGTRWLKSFDVVWVGGSAISEALALQARRKEIRLAPCYGSTETAAMVTALSPKAFLSGEEGCGHPLEDVELRLNHVGALEIKTQRLALARWKEGSLENLPKNSGWWQSGDLAKLTQCDCLLRLEILGRLDTAIHSGGETIFPEQLERRLVEFAKKNNLQIQNIMLLTVDNIEWGERLVGLIKWEAKLTTLEKKQQFKIIESLIKTWLPAERPFTWHDCPSLAVNSVGKWERLRWKKWLNQVTSN